MTLEKKMVIASVIIKKKNGHCFRDYPCRCHEQPVFSLWYGAETGHN
jgi:hypothetical protein